MDIAIAGAGPVGAACALFLLEAGFAARRIRLVDARPREAAAEDTRMIALAHGSAALLARLGVWRDRAEVHATAIEAIHVSQRGRFGRTLIAREEHGVPALGYVIRYGDLVKAFDAALAERGLAVMRPFKTERIVPDDGALVLELTGGEQKAMRARHVVHAEGGLFDMQRARALHRDYAQSALTAFVMPALSLNARLAHTAFERFTETGPIALLPARIATGSGYSLVWCGRPDETEARIALCDADFLEALHASFGDRLGPFKAVGARRVFPLGLNAVATTARAVSETSAEIAIGNAAQTLHPVAGQGLNLGLRDAFMLAEAMRTHFDDAPALAAAFIAARRFDRAATVGLTDLMPRAFASGFAPTKVARGAALFLLDLLPQARNLLVRQMMNGQR